MSRRRIHKGFDRRRSFCPREVDVTFSGIVLQAACCFRGGLSYAQIASGTPNTTFTLTRTSNCGYSVTNTTAMVINSYSGSCGSGLVVLNDLIINLAQSPTPGLWRIDATLGGIVELFRGEADTLDDVFNNVYTSLTCGAFPTGNSIFGEDGTATVTRCDE